MHPRLAASALVCAVLAAFAVTTPTGPARAATVGSQLRAGQSLSLGDRLVSANGQRTLDLQRSPSRYPGLFVDTFGLDLTTDGCGPTYVDSRVDIEERRSRIVMQHDGNLVWYRGPYPLMSSGTHGHPGAYAVLHDDGRFVVHSSTGFALWKLDTPCTFLTANSGEENLTSPAYLRPGWFMQDENRRYKLTMQRDGNLVLTGPRGRPLWNSRTAGHPGAYLVKQPDGNLVIYAPNRRALWNSRTAGRPADEVSYLSVEPDGDVVLYQMERTPWRTGTAGRL